MAGVVPGDAPRPMEHSSGLDVLCSTNSAVLLVLGPHIVHHIFFESRPAAHYRSHRSVSTLRSCMLVCRAWAPVARRYLQQTMLSRVWFLAIQQLGSSGDHSSLSIPPAAYPVLRAARSMLRNPLPKVPAGTVFSSVTWIELGSPWMLNRVAITCDVDRLCQTIASLAPLRNLRLVHLAWASSGSKHSQLPVASHSCAHLHRIDVWAQWDWLLDIHSAHFITWLARSGTASELTDIHFERMMILEERLLAAVAAVIDASKCSLQRLFLNIGPDLAIYSRRYLWSFTVDL